MTDWLSLPGRLLRPLKRWRARREARKSIGPLLKRPSDHLLDDIGLTRQDLRVMLDQWED